MQIWYHTTLAIDTQIFLNFNISAVKRESRLIIHSSNQTGHSTSMFWTSLSIWGAYWKVKIRAEWPNRPAFISCLWGMKRPGVFLLSLDGVCAGQRHCESSVRVVWEWSKMSYTMFLAKTPTRVAFSLRKKQSSVYYKLGTKLTEKITSPMPTQVCQSVECSYYCGLRWPEE